MTRYIFDKDTGGESVCNGQCVENWPPLIADTAAVPRAGYSIMTRDDGGVAVGP